MSENMPGAAVAQPAPGVKKGLAFAALILTLIAAVLIILGFFMAAKAGVAAIEALDVDAASSADGTRLIMLAVASVLNLVAFILSLIALIKSKPKVLPLIIFLVVLILPSIALGIGMAIQSNMLAPYQ